MKTHLVITLANTRSGDIPVADPTAAAKQPLLQRVRRFAQGHLRRQECRRSVALIIALAFLSAASPAFADLPQQRKALDELQAAKKAADPLPLLESAKARIEKANKGNKGGDKEGVIAKIDEAIAEAKAGNKSKMEQKISAAISNLHQGKDKSKRPK